MGAAVWRVGRTAASVAASTTSYDPLGDGNGWQGHTVEVRAQSKLETAGTFSRMQIYVQANDRGASTLVLRKNTASGNLSVSISASTTGNFEDVANTDVVVATDIVNRRLVTGAGGTTLVLGQISVVFSATSNTVQRFSFDGNLTATLNNYWPISGNTNSSTTEALRETQVLADGTFKNGCVSTDSNSRNGNVTIVLRKSGVTSALSISVTASTTGHFEDTSNTVAVLAGDRAAWLVSADAGASGTLTMRNLGIDFETTDGSWFHALQTGSTLTFTRNSTFYLPLSGLPSASSTEDVVQQRGNIDHTLSFARFYTDTNGITSGTSTLKSRINGADGTIAVSISASATGTFTDVAHTDAVLATDLVNLSISTGVGSGAQTLQIRSASIKAAVVSGFDPTTVASFAGAYAMRTRTLRVVGY